MACETKDFQKALSAPIIKIFEKGVHLMDDCFVERRFQKYLSIAALRFGSNSSNDIAISFFLTEQIRHSTPFDP